MFYNLFFIASAKMPQMSPRMWKNNEFFYQYVKEANRVSEFNTKSMRTLVSRMRCAEVRNKNGVMMNRCRNCK